ncbi:MAG: hypothetical protein JWR16_2198 [Nevskia sp.]|nr:hypothetical protein [Nevskia sp.]
MDRLTEETTPPPRVYTASHYSGGDSSECFALIDEKGNINERMRHGYHEPEGEYLRGRLREINRRLWELHCPRQ